MKIDTKLKIKERRLVEAQVRALMGIARRHLKEKERIRKLLALSRGTPYQHEACLARETAERLMTKHGITEDEL